MATIKPNPGVHAVVMDGPSGRLLVTDDKAFDTSDWVVINHPEFFTIALGRSGQPRVEQATAAPGERRNR